MNIETMRREIAKVYTGNGWQKKVKAMPENQVVAVYHTFQKNGKLNQPRRVQTGPVYTQLTFDDILRTK